MRWSRTIGIAAALTLVGFSLTTAATAATAATGRYAGVAIGYDPATGSVSRAYLVVGDDDDAFNQPVTESGNAPIGTIDGITFDAQDWTGGHRMDLVTSSGTVLDVDAMSTTLNGWQWYVLAESVDARTVGRVDRHSQGTRPVVAAPYADYGLLARGAVGTSGDDLLVGSGGQQLMSGLAGADFMDGWNGPDFLTGNGGDDHLSGGTGNDRLFGRGGGDVIHDGDGFDKLTGNAGPDLFVLHPSDGDKDRIVDYEDNLDKIQLPGVTYPDLTLVDRRPGRVLIKYGTERLIVKDPPGTNLLSAADLSPSDFIFTQPTDRPLYRVNAGGPLIAALDDGPDWTRDTEQNPSPYVNFVNGDPNNLTVAWPTPSLDTSVPASTPATVFEAERYDSPGGNTMSWSFPTVEGIALEVRLYLANGFDGASQPGQRRFDVTIDG